MLKTIDIFTDGACRGNPGPGGWGALLRYHKQDKAHEKTLNGAEPHTTNNRMEMMAAIKALEALKTPCQINLYTDSKYLMDGITRWIHGWKKKNWQTSQKEPVKNADLWQILEPLTHRHQVSWHWVRGHSGHPENEQVDALAREAIDRFLSKGSS